MPKAIDKIKAYKGKLDPNFVGMIVLKDPKKTLPDGSQMSLAIKKNKWFLAYQKSSYDKIKTFELNLDNKEIMVDKKTGTARDVSEMRKLIDYFFGNIDDKDLVSIVPKK